MASTASSSRIVPVQARQADPLPPKVGEFGYGLPVQETDLAGPSSEEHDEDASADNMHDVELNDRVGRHPADRPYRAASEHSAAASSASLASTSTAAIPKPPKHRSLFFRLTSSRGPPLLRGMYGPSLLRVVAILLALAGVITGWVLTVSHLNGIAAASQSSSSSSSGSNTDDDDSSVVPIMPGATFIFVHIAFAVGVLLLLVFLERATYQLRAERWRFQHPGESLPRREFPAGGGGIGIAPWNRPPLPTYAAALGHIGTGDVEDAAIAVAPPPMYGQTRGSTLLLSSLMPAGLRRVSAQSTSSSMTARERDRPVSYRETDEEADAISDAMRARQLEISLARLEEGAPQPTDRS